MGNVQGETVPDRWLELNSIFVWILTLGLFVIMILTSSDYSKSFFNFNLFGAPQLVLVGFMTFLLLFRFISKIRIGDVVEIEMSRALKLSLNSQRITVNALDSIMGSIPSNFITSDNSSNVHNQIRAARNNISEAEDILKTYS
jgi:hypothetical protein